MTSRRIEVFQSFDTARSLVNVETQFVRVQAGPTNGSSGPCTWKAIIKVFDGYSFEIDFYDGGKFLNRLAYASAADRPADDPIAFPRAALCAARQGCHSSGLGYDEIEAVVKRALGEEEFKIAMRISESQKNIDLAGPADWTNRLAEINAQKNIPANVDVGSKVRQSRAYPATASNPRPESSS